MFRMLFIVFADLFIASVAKFLADRATLCRRRFG